MHELSVAKAMMAVVFENAAANGAKKIHRVEVKVGKLVGVVPESLIFCFNSLKEGTIAENAVLEIHEQPGRAHCDFCRMDFEVGPYDFFCPGCRRPVVPYGGQELDVLNMEVE